MSDLTKILSAIEEGDANAASDLLPLVYEELRKLAAAKMAKEQSGQTLQPTVLVHEAYLRLVGEDESRQWVATGSEDHTVQLWNLDVDSVLQRAQQLAGRELSPDEEIRYRIGGTNP